MNIKVLILLTASISYIHADEWGMINVPVADMFLKPVAFYNVDPQHIPLSSSTDEKKAVPRAHQALFNEKVRIIATFDNEVLCEIPGLVYGRDEKTGALLNQFWTLKSNIWPISTDPERPDNIDTLLPGSDNSIILVRPVQEQKSAHYYSVGTKFIYEPSQDTLTTYGIRIYNGHTNAIIFSSIPKAAARIFTVRTAHQGRALFVELLNGLIDQAEGIVPFTWGGSSLQHYYADEPALSHQITIKDPTSGEDKVVTIWNRKEQYHPASGYDAAELILRVCSLCGIPFPFKTTAMMHQFLKPIATEELEEGDFFWTPGGLVTISSLKNNQVIAASGYLYGYGKIIRYNLKDLFKGIENFPQLHYACHEKKPIDIVDRNGNVYKTVTEYALLKFTSIDQAIEELRKHQNSNSNAN